MEQFLVISAIGRDPGLVIQNLTRMIAECGGNIRECRMTALGSEFGTQLLVAGNWHTVSRLERDLDRFASQNDLTMQCRRTEAREFDKALRPYAVDVIGLDQPGIVNSLTGFFSSRSVEICELSTHSYVAVQTDTAMFSVQMFINVPATLHISALREEFMEFCDQINVDAIMEPVKHS